MNRIRWYGPTLAVLLTVVVIMIAGPAMVRNIVYAKEQGHVQLARKSLSENQLLADLSRAFRNVSEAVQPSVVSIQTFAKRSRVHDEDQELRELFRNRWPFADPSREEDRDEENDRRYEEFDKLLPIGIGSGWVYDIQGHIITNNHVVTLRDRKTITDKIEVHFANGDKRIANVVGNDPDTDVAVLKVEGEHLHPARLAQEPVHQGEIVFAFGSPLQFEFSVSQGVVSAKNRHVGIVGSRTRRGFLGGYENFIQTDAAINQGNSGGPLTNIFGEVIGMNTAIATDNLRGGFLGVGFAIPIGMIKDVVDKIIEHGRVVRGWLGISYQPLTAKEATTYGYQDGPAILLESVLEEGPAANSGLKRNDLILKIGDTRLKDGPHLKWLVASFQPGTEIDVEVFRDGKVNTIKVKLDERPSSDQITRLNPSFADEPTEGEILRKIGIESALTFTKDLAEELRVDHVPGVMINRVRRGSIAAEKGLRKGDIISEVMGKPVQDASSLIEHLIANKDRELVRLTVILARSGFQERTIFIEIP